MKISKSVFENVALSIFVLIFATTVAKDFAKGADAAGKQNLPASTDSSTESPNQKRGVSLDTLLDVAFENRVGTFVDSETGALVITGTVIIDRRVLINSDLVHLRHLMELGFWSPSKGRVFDLRQATIVITDGGGGLGDTIALFGSRVFSKQFIVRRNYRHIGYFNAGSVPVDLLEAFKQMPKGSTPVVGFDPVWIANTGRFDCERHFGAGNYLNGFNL